MNTMIHSAQISKYSSNCGKFVKSVPRISMQRQRTLALLLTNLEQWLPLRSGLNESRNITVRSSINYYI